MACRLLSADAPCKADELHKASSSASVRSSRVSLRLLSIRSPPASRDTSPPEITWFTHKLPVACLMAMPPRALAVKPPKVESCVWMFSVDLTVPFALNSPMPPVGAAK